MRIASNIPAMTTYRHFTAASEKISILTERLSSGSRINRAADDAAGLFISEKMRAQIRGIQMAVRNCQDAISLVQTAEGALQETHNILQRMNELAVQSNTGTNENLDREALDSEYQELLKEINDTAKTTKFNNIPLLDGSSGGGSLVADKNGVNNPISGTLVEGNSLGNTEIFSINKAGDITAGSPGSYTFSVGRVDETGKFVGNPIPDGEATHIQVQFTDDKTGDIINRVLKFSDVVKGDLTSSNQNIELDLREVGLGVSKLTSGSALANGKQDFEQALIATTLTTKQQNVWGAPADPNISKINYTGADSAKIKIDDALNGSLKFTNLYTGQSINLSFGTTLATPGKTVEIDLGEIGLGKLEITARDTDAMLTTDFTSNLLQFEGAGKGSGIVIQVGPDAGQTMEINIERMDAQSLGLVGSSIAKQGNGGAGDAIEKVKNAINKVSKQRGYLGGVENRLDTR